jgi:hypothetical protein
MTTRLKTLMAAACLGLMLVPAMVMAAEDDSATPPDNGQMMDQADPGSADNPGASGNSGSSDESAMPESGQGSDEAAPSDSGSTDEAPADTPAAE